MTAKKVLRHAGIKRVRRQRVFSPQETKFIPAHEQMQETAFAAYAAIAIGCLDVRWRVNFETHSAAVATASVCRHYGPPLCQTATLLFDGTAYKRCRCMPPEAANASSNSMSRIPMTGSRCRRLASKSALLCVLNSPRRCN